LIEFGLSTTGIQNNGVGVILAKTGVLTYLGKTIDTIAKARAA
jgi:hypothetical protein